MAPGSRQQQHIEEAHPPFEDRMSNIITNRGRKRNEASPALGNRSSMVTPLIPSGKDTPFYQGLA
jgi:hypothetical protein